MIILDTNVLSEVMRAEPQQNVVAWLDTQPAASVWITAISVMEIRFGLQAMPGGRRRQALLRSFDFLLNRLIEGRIAGFDAEAATHAAELMVRRKRLGRPTEVRDTMIAGIVLASHATLATRNTRHFEDLLVTLVDPWKS